MGRSDGMAIESEKSLQRFLLRTTTDMDQQEGVTLAVRRKTSLLIFYERALIGVGFATRARARHRRQLAIEFRFLAQPFSPCSEATLLSLDEPKHEHDGDGGGNGDSPESRS